MRAVFKFFFIVFSIIMGAYFIWSQVGPCYNSLCRSSVFLLLIVAVWAIGAIFLGVPLLLTKLKRKEPTPQNPDERR